MWGRQSKSPLLLIVITPDNFTCAIMRRTGNKQLMVQAYQSFPYHALECAKLMVHNPTHVAMTVRSFIKRHQITRPRIMYSLTGASVHEEVISLPSTQTITTILNAKKAKTYRADHAYLYHQDDGRAFFYTCFMPHALMLQYHLLSSIIGAHTMYVSTGTMALLALYEYSMGAAFRHAQLGIDIQHVHHHIEHLLTKDLFARMVQVPSQLVGTLSEQIKPLAHAAGLFVIGESIP